MAFHSIAVSRREFAAGAANLQTVTPGELGVVQAHVEEVGRETGHLGARVAALEDDRGELRSVARQSCTEPLLLYDTAATTVRNDTLYSC